MICFSSHQRFVPCQVAVPRAPFLARRSSRALPVVRSVDVLPPPSLIPTRGTARPLPFLDLGHVVAVLAHVVMMLDQGIAKHLLEVRADLPQSRHLVDHAPGE